MRIIEKPIEDRTLAIVAMGNSHRDYVYYNFDKEKEANVADEVWAINSIALVIKCDKAVMMDDFKGMSEKPERLPFVNRVKKELLDQGTQVISSRAYEEFGPNLVEYPLVDILNKFQYRYLNGSVAYALTYAMYLGYKRVILYGCDYMYDHKPEYTKRGAVV